MEAHNSVVSLADDQYSNFDFLETVVPEGISSFSKLNDSETFSFKPNEVANQNVLTNQDSLIHQNALINEENILNSNDGENTNTFNDELYANLQWNKTWSQPFWERGLTDKEFLTISTDMNLFETDCVQTINDKPFELQLQTFELKEEEQKTVNIKKETTSEITDNTIRTDVKFKTEQEIKEKIFKSPTNNTLPVLSYETNKKNDENIKKDKNTKRRKKKKENSVTIKKMKLEEQEDCIDVETIPRDEVPVLEAADVASLLEKFEASENPNPCNKSIIKNSHTYDTKPNKTCQVTQEWPVNISEKSVLQASNQQKNVQTSILSKNNKIKSLERKKTIPIAAMPNIQSKNRSNNARMQNGAPCSNKVLKTSSTIPNNDKTFNKSKIVVQLDHDYCNNANFHTNSCSNNKTTKHTSILKSNQNKNWSKFEKYHNNINSNKVQCNLESTNVCDANRKPAVLQNKTEDNLLENNRKEIQKEIPLKQSHDSSNSSTIKNISVPNESFKQVFQPSRGKPCPLPINSVLARRIIQSHRNISIQANIAQTSPKTQYISVLKNPPNSSQSSSSTNNFNENIVTATNGLNNEVQNIIVQNTQDTLPHEKEKTNRKKLNIEEYRERKNKNCINKVEIASSPNICTAKKKSDIDKEEKNDPERSTCDVEIETVFESLNVVNVQKKEKREENTKNEESCKRASRSLSRSRSKSRNRNKINRSRSRSRNRNRSRRRNRNRRSRRRSRSNSKSRSQSRRRSRSRSRRKNRSRSKRRNRSRSKKRSRSRSKKRSRSRSRRRSRSRSRRRSRSRSRRRSRSKSRTRSRNRSRSITRSRSTTRSRSKSRSRSCLRSNTRRRTISHRRSSVNSTSSWSSRSHVSTKYSDSGSSSQSYNRSRSSSRSSLQYSSHSRSSLTSNRRNWSSQRNSSKREICDVYGRSCDILYPSFSRPDYKNYSRSLHPYHESYTDNWHNREKQKEIKERRVLYVGRLGEEVTKTDLRKRFEVFGTVIDVSVHFRERGENYGFVTFRYKTDAYKALEHGNDDPSLPKYQLCFGGRRNFCRSPYSDLDDMRNDTSISKKSQVHENISFDILLKDAQERVEKNK